MDLLELKDIAGREMAKHGLHGWTFAVAEAKRRLGVCRYRTKRIEIGEYYARNNPPEAVLDTLMHEIAHAIAGHAAGHGPVWKAVAVRLGATPRAYDSSHETIIEPGDWQATCPACANTFHRYKRPGRSTRYHCRCPARSPLVFEYKGNVTAETAEPTIPRPGNYEAKCPGCGTVHRRVRCPRAGIWRCQCPHRCELTWLHLRKFDPLRI